jgi:hypothetical protein
MLTKQEMEKAKHVKMEEVLNLLWSLAVAVNMAS